MYLIHVVALVIAELSLHVILLDVRALRVDLVLIVVNLIDANLRCLRNLLLAASAPLQAHLVVSLTDVPCLLHCRDGGVRLRLHLVVVLVDQELLVFVSYVLVLLALQVVIHVDLQIVNVISALGFGFVPSVFVGHTVVLVVPFATEDLVALEAVAELTLVIINNVDLISDDQGCMLFVLRHA